MNYLQLLRREPAAISFGTLHYLFSGPGQTFFISLFVPYFLVAADITNDRFNWIYLVATLLSALTLPSLGGLIDRVKIRYVSVGIGLGLMVFTVLASFAFSWWYLILVVYGLRLFGQGMMPLTGATAIARYFTVARGKALSLINFGVSLGEIVFPLIIVALIGWIGWRGSWLATAGLILFAFLPLILTLIPVGSRFQLPLAESPEPGQPTVRSATRGEVIKDPRFYLLTTVYIFVPMFMTGFMLNQSQVGGLLDVTEAQMALGISMFGSARMGFNLLAGPLVDRFTATRVFAFLLLPLLAGAVLLLLFPSQWTVWGFFLGAGMSSSISSLTTTAMWAEIYGTEHLGAIRSLVSTFMVFSTAIGPVLVGLGLANLAEFQTMFWIVIGVMLVFTALAQWQVRRM